MKTAKSPADSESDVVRQRHSKLEGIRDLGHDLYPHKYELTHSIPELLRLFSEKSAEELEQEAPEVQTAGRLVALRGHGKAGFAHLYSGGQRIQLYVRMDRVGKDNYDLYRLLDIGDFVGVRGVMFRTRTGELTIFADGLDFLAKSLRPLPEKWHGLTDVEARYRRRYLDLIANPSVRGIFVRRSQVISVIRQFLEDRGYLEVETPMMQSIAGGATARPFKTFHEALNIPLYLRIAPELYLKRLVVGGFDRVYEINRNFRNEGISTQHNPEFTMLEFYQAYSDYRELMDLTEELLRQVCAKVTGKLEIQFSGENINFDSFSRFSMLEAIQHFWPQGPAPSMEDLGDAEKVGALLQQVGQEAASGEGWGKRVEGLFETVVERHLIQPTFIYDFPLELSPLSKQKDEDPRFAERFELFVGGLEVANAYSELNDPQEQRRRLQQQLEARQRGDSEAHQMDEDYVGALQYGMPPTAGEGIGIDRLVMILTDSPSIREVILFPHLRPAAAQT